MKLIELIVEKMFTTDASFARTILERIADKLGNARDFNHFAEIINGAFAKHKISFFWEYDPEGKDIDHDKWFFMGVSSAYYQGGKVEVGTNPYLVSSFRNPKKRAQVINYIESIIKHELIHKEQDKLSKGKFDKWTVNKTAAKRFKWESQSYLADPHELQAMAYEIVNLLRRQNYSDAEIIDSLKTDNKLLMKAHRYVWVKSQFTKESDPTKAVNRLHTIMWKILTTPPLDIKNKKKDGK